MFSMTRRDCNHDHNILKVPDVLTNFHFTTSERKCDYS